MESLQQATDGEGQRGTHRGIKRATLHSGGTLRTNRYRKQNQKAGERLPLCIQGEVTDSTVSCIT